MIFLGVVRMSGFGSQGVGRRRSSYGQKLSTKSDLFDNTGGHASRYQSRHYGGYIPRGSTFSHYQSYGAARNYPYDFDDESYGYDSTSQELDGILWRLFSWYLFMKGIQVLNQ